MSATAQGLVAALDCRIELLFAGIDPRHRRPNGGPARAATRGPFPTERLQYSGRAKYKDGSGDQIGCMSELVAKPIAVAVAPTGMGATVLA